MIVVLIAAAAVVVHNNENNNSNGFLGLFDVPRMEGGAALKRTSVECAPVNDRKGGKTPYCENVFLNNDRDNPEFQTRRHQE